jgi:uncharacterized protein YbjT (DUF2867 family)
MNHVLVLGGTGFVGRHLCEKIQREGWSCTVPTRRFGHAQAVQHLPRLTVLEANVHDEASLLRLLPGHDAVVNLVAILHGTEASFERTHVTLPATLARACRASGVQRVVHVSALGVTATGPSMYQRSKARGEAALAAAGLDLSVLRPSVIFGAGDKFLNLFARLQAFVPLVPLAGAHARFQPVWVEDVASAVVACLRDPGRARAAGGIFDCVGPDVFTLADLVRLAGRVGSRERPVVPLPALLARLQALAMELMPGEPLMSRDNLAAMSVDNVSAGRLPGLAALGIEAASLSATAPSYLRRGAAR